jgi:hypothetical protein
LWIGKHNGAKIDPEQEKRVFCNDRERAALEIIAQSKASVAVLVYGGAHTFVESVDDWNKNHPELAYSIVAITPKHYWHPTILK